MVVDVTVFFSAYPYPWSFFSLGFDIQHICDLTPTFVATFVIIALAALVVGGRVFLTLIACMASLSSSVLQIVPWRDLRGCLAQGARDPPRTNSRHSTHHLPMIQD